MCSSDLYSKRVSEGYGENTPSPAAQSPWHGSSHSLLSPAPSRNSSPSGLPLDSKLLTHSLTTHSTTMETDIKGTDRSKSNTRRGLEALLTSEPKRNPVETEEVGMTIEDYIILADIPRCILGVPFPNPCLLMGVVVLVRLARNQRSAFCRHFHV